MENFIEKTMRTPRICPKQHSVVKKFQFVNKMPVACFFYCEICKKRYEEAQLTRRDSQVIRSSTNKEQASRISFGVQKSRNNKSSKIDTNNVKYYDGKPIGNVVTQTAGLPNKCPLCSTSTERFIYIVKVSSVKEKYLPGKECKKCKGIFIMQDIYLAHSKYFELDNEHIDGNETVQLNIDDVCIQEDDDKVFSECVQNVDSIVETEELIKENYAELIIDRPIDEITKCYVDDFGREFYFEELKYLLDI